MAQDFADEWDGIVAGAPAVSFDNLTSWSGHFYPLTGPTNSSRYLSPAKWVTVHLDVLKNCDKIDGYQDGILEDPLLCHYDPSDLACGGGNETDACLTPDQLATVKAIYSPLLNDQGDLVYPRFNPGAEVIGAYAVFNGMPFSYSQDWFRYVIFNDTTWDPATLSPKDYDTAARQNPAGIETWKGDLSAAKDNGTKILHWHGTADYIISSDNSARYYEHVSSTMGLSPHQLDEFYRFFHVSGTGHCGGGDGAHAIGQGLTEINGYDPQHNVLMALVDWVEKGNAPKALIGTKYVNDTQALGVDFERAHCKYPKSNFYKGQGDPKLPENWRCKDVLRSE